MNTLLQLIFPGEMRSRVMGIWALIFGGMIGTPATMAISALIGALAALVTPHVIRKREAQLAAVA